MVQKPNPAAVKKRASAQSEKAGAAGNKPRGSVPGSIFIGRIKDISLFQIADGGLNSRQLKHCDTIVVPTSSEGLAGTFLITLEELDVGLGDRIHKHLSGIFLRTASPPEDDLARLIDQLSPRVIAVRSSLPGRRLNIGKATTSAIRLALDQSSKRILLPVPGVGLGIADGAVAGKEFGRALVKLAYESHGQPVEIFYCTTDPAAREMIRTEWSKLGPKTAKPGSAKPKMSLSATKAKAAEAPKRTLRDYSAAGFRADVLDRRKDFVGVGAETHAFAKLAASREIAPPLAIGVFGDWGSGKSFFMACVQQKIEAFAARAANDPASGFHANIVQINFNAWHYIESNLWASLVEFIFAKLEEWLRRANNENPDSVGSMFDALATSRQLKLETARAVVAANLELHNAQKAVAVAEQAKAEKLARNATAAKALLGFVAGEILASKQFEGLKKQIERTRLNDVSANAEELAALGARLQTVHGRSQTLWRSARGLAGSWWGWAAVASLVAVPTILPQVLDWAANEAGGTVPQVSQYIAGAAAFLATAAGWLKAFLGVANPALDKAERFFAKVEERRRKLESDATDSQAKALAEAQTALSDAEKAVDAARERLRLAAIQAAEAQNTYHSESARGRLNRFIRERLADGTYGKHLGLIATIRKDFEQITVLMEQADPDSADQQRLEAERKAFDAKVDALIREATLDGTSLLSGTDLEQLKLSEEGGRPPQTFERIVLYIDDLDRCPPTKVVEVMQAIHMLLCFGLFVVFVAVDARWVAGALEQTFKGQLRDGDGHSETAAARTGATPEDYMEKIFQIPYWVRPLEGKAATGFMKKLVNDFGIEAGGPSAQSAHAAAMVAAEALSLGGTVSPLSESEIKAPIPQTGATGAPSPETAADPVAPDLGDGDPGVSLARAEKLMLGPEDLSALAALAPTIGDSPRRLKRFFNTYLLIQTIAGVMIGDEATDYDPELRAACETMLGQCSYEQQALALATSLALSMIEGAGSLSAVELANLTPDGLEKLVAPVMRASRLSKPVATAVTAYLETKTAAKLPADGLESAFTFFLPLARRYGFKDFDA